MNRVVMPVRLSTASWLAILFSPARPMAAHQFPPGSHRLCGPAASVPKTIRRFLLPPLTLGRNNGLRQMSTQSIPLSSSVPLFAPHGGAAQELFPSPAKRPAELHHGASIPFEHATAAHEQSFTIFEQSNSEFYHSKTASERSSFAWHRPKTAVEHANTYFEHSTTVIERSIEIFERGFTRKTRCFSLKAPVSARF